MMKRKLCALLGLSLISFVSAHAESFVRPVTYYVHPEAAGYDDNAAIGVALGTTTGEKQEHEVSFEFDFAHWRYRHADHYTDGENYLPILLNYRYRFGSEDSKVRFYFGPSVGYTRSWISYDNRASDGNWSFTYSGVGGVLIRLARRIDLDVGYRYLKADSTAAVNALEAHMLYAGANFHF